MTDTKAESRRYTLEKTVRQLRLRLKTTATFARIEIFPKAMRYVSQFL